MLTANCLLPMKLTKTSTSEVKLAHKMVDELNEVHPELIDSYEILEADRKHDETNLFEKLWDDYVIKPIIDIKICGKI
jgi:thymidylate synthase ThyX